MSERIDSDSTFKKSALLVLFTIGCTLSVHANAALVLGADQSVITQNSGTGARPPVAISPQVDNGDPLQVVRTMAANDKIYFLARGKAKSSTDGTQMLGLQVICRGAESKEFRFLWSTRNHEGKDAYPEDNGVLSLDVRYLFIAPVADSYTCTLRGQNFRGQDAVAGVSYWTLLKGASNTFLSVDYSVPNSLSWGTELDPKDYRRAQNAGKNPETPYLYSSTNVQIADTGLLFNKPGEYALRSPDWIPTTSKIKAISDIEMTVCYYGTGSCDDYAYGDKLLRSEGSVVKTRLIVDQIPAGSTAFCARTVTPFVETKISSNTHHQKIYHTINEVPVLPSDSKCGAGSHFSSRVEIQWLEGNPVRVEDSEYSQGAFINVGP